MSKHRKRHFNKHHVIPKSRGGEMGRTINLPVEFHQAWHEVFGNLYDRECVEFLIRLLEKFNDPKVKGLTEEDLQIERTLIKSRGREVNDMARERRVNDMVRKNKKDRMIDNKNIKPKFLLEDAVKIIKKWRMNLGLSDWEITVAIRHLPDDNAAQVRPNFPYKKALILLDPEWINTRIIGEQTLERTLIHELLHISIGTIRFMSETMLKNDGKLSEERKEILLFFEEQIVEVLSRFIYKMSMKVRTIITYKKS